jgi:CubicO group peptidase (beta-lactamase class C family)
MKKTYILILFFLFLQGIRAQSFTPLFIVDSMDAYIQKGLNEWNLPGLAVVIVTDGQVVWMKGYGVRDIMSKKPVDEHLLFMIASNTKLITGSAVAMIETEKNFH